MIWFVYQWKNISVEPQQQIKFIVRSAKQRDRRMSITKYSKIEIPSQVLFEYVTSKCELPTIEWRSLSYSQDLENLLVQYEQKTIQSIKFKVGVIYRKKGQKTEEQLYANDTSPEFESFMDCLGDRIELLNWPKFAGGLDTKSPNQTWFATMKNYDIIFHCAPKLPKNPKDAQQLERKRHVGNDIVVIIYDESGEPFSPLMITSKVTHAYIVVRPIDVSKSIYSVAIANRGGVATYLPPIPNQFTKGELFKNWMLTKIINGERATITSAVFKQRVAKTRGVLLNELLEKLIGVNSK